ncbi:MAG TPA: DUF1343 domain-containing protein [Blastocatellia bacterium]|nr:DUF1343 domain-containing protein [Blastocatellia bacterium]
MNRIVLGLEKLLSERAPRLKGSRLGLICNPSTVDHGFRHAVDLLSREPDLNLTTVFGPQHGLYGETQDNMIEWEGAPDPRTGPATYSLYGQVREPTAAMLENVDVLVFDLQDVGTRVYTFVYTMALAMRAAARFGKRVMVLDRPNPIGGCAVEGNLLEPGHESFVGMFPIPMRHGMTVGELAGMFNQEFGIGCELEVVPMEGYRREYWFDQTDAPWVIPSPNMPTLDTATVYPGAVLIEGTRISEGRGTTRPFEIVGAPGGDAPELASQLNRLGLPGVYFRAHCFIPTFQKHAGQLCQGVQLHVLDRQAFKPVVTGIAVIKLIRDLDSKNFQWQAPPYEYVYDRLPFDVIAGTSKLREQIESGESVEAIAASWKAGEKVFLERRAPYLIYGEEER